MRMAVYVRRQRELVQRRADDPGSAKATGASNAGIVERIIKLLVVPIN